MREVTKKRKILKCGICGKRSKLISQNGLCKDCIMNKIKSANLQIITKQGPIYEKWKQKIIDSMN